MTVRDQQFRYSQREIERLLAAFAEVYGVPVGEHLTEFEVLDYVFERLNSDAQERLERHLATCRECLEDLDLLYELYQDDKSDVAPPVARPPQFPVHVAGTVGSTVEASAVGSAATFGEVAPLSRRSGRVQKVTFRPSYPRRPQPVCVVPVQLAAQLANEEDWPGVQFDRALHCEFGAPFPDPHIRGDASPLLVTTPLRASMEYQTTGKWRVIVPLALAPQDTLIVVRRDSKLRGLHDLRLVRALEGRRIAVADVTSAYAARLASAANSLGFDVQVVTRQQRGRSLETLQLATMSMGEMSEALANGEVDGIATVEPIPTMVRSQMGADFATVTLRNTCTATATGFCCVVVAPATLLKANRYKDAYENLVLVLFRSVCRLLKHPERDSAQFAAYHEVHKIAHHERRRGTAHHESQEMAVGSATMVRQAAARIARRASGKAEDAPSSRSLAERLVEELVPEVTLQSLNAEYAALFRYQGRARRLALREAVVARPKREPLYDVQRLRSLCREAVDIELGKGHDLELNVKNMISNEPLKILRGKW